MRSRPIVLVHGYSADGHAFDAWKRILRGAGHHDLHVVEYESLSDDVTLGDLAEGFERALRACAGLAGGQAFDAIVHSTGMLVLRSWLASSDRRRARLGRLVALAPASFGSPLAHKGRGMLGAVFKGNRRLGPDFLEAGSRILGSLELGSPDTWALAERDLRVADGARPPTSADLHVFVLCGVDGYPFPMSVINGPGSDGTVRLAGCAVDGGRITLDLTRGRRRRRRTRVHTSTHADVPVVPIAGCHHGSILHAPTATLRRFVLEALEVDGPAAFGAWNARARRHRDHLSAERGDLAWQQIVVRVRDERGEPVPDYYVEFLTKGDDGGGWRPIRDVFRGFQFHVHVHAADPSYRCFHVDLASAELGDRPIGLRLLAHSGTDLVGYRGYRQRMTVTDGRGSDGWDGLIDLSELANDTRFFRPLTTTLVEIRLDREPLPARGESRLVRILSSVEGDR